jgi:hypothetical protein
LDPEAHFEKSKVKTITRKTPPKEVPEDLANQFQSVKALTVCHQLLCLGHFQHQHQSLLTQSIGFIEFLHEQVITEALNHKDAKMIPQLKAELKKRKEKKDGQS